MALRRFYVPPQMVRRPHPEITGPEAGHICRVLRLSAGDAVELFDGAGNGYLAQIVSATPERVRLVVQSKHTQPADASVRITVAQAMLKERKMDRLIRHLTELGIDRWIPFYAARSIPLAGGKGLGSRMARWEKIALAAAKQCRRNRLPQIVPALDFDAMQTAAGPCDLAIIFYEGRTGAFDLPATAPQKPNHIVVAVGPEGGFDSAEMARAQQSGWLSAGLGPRILRAETACLAACTLLQYRFGDMGPAGAAGLEENHAAPQLDHS